MATIEIYTSPFCAYCHRAKALLTKRGLAFTEIDVVMNPERRREMEARAPGVRTVPQIFIDGRHIGGSDDLTVLDQAGTLMDLTRDRPEQP
jgi:glutaredoxin 3